MRLSRSAMGVLVLLAFCAGCMSPKDRRPGLRLRGEVVAAPVSDWSFSDADPEIELETRTWYGLRHSVTTVCAQTAGRLYVPSIYFQGGAWPDKFWNRNVEADPRVRLRIDGRVYERRAVVVSDPAERATAIQALAAKYDFWRELLAKPESERPDLALVRMDRVEGR